MANFGIYGKLLRIEIMLDGEKGGLMVDTVRDLISHKAFLEY